jgi:hypothetical protein
MEVPGVVVDVEPEPPHDEGWCYCQRSIVHSLLRMVPVRVLISHACTKSSS